MNTNIFETLNFFLPSLQKEVYILSPLDQFEVINFIGFNTSLLGSLNFSITNLTLYLCLVLIFVSGSHIYANNDGAIIPNEWSIAFESTFATIKNIVREQIGENKEIYFPFIYSLFFFVLIANLISNVPYSFGVTTSAIVCLGLSFMIFFGVTILALYLHQLKFFSFFIPSGTPLALVPLLVLIELVSYCARAISLGVRLFANLVAGHTLLKILSTFLYKMFSASLIIFIVTLIPFTIFLGLTGLEVAVSFIQAYVLTLLTCSYIKDAVYLH